MPATGASATGASATGAPPRSTARRLAGHLVALTTGAGLMRLIALVSQVTIARIVGPSSLGALAIAQALVAISSIFTDGGMTVLTLRRIVREPARVSRLASTTLYGQLGLGVAALVVLDVIALALPGRSRLTLLILVLTPSLLCSAFNMSYVLKSVEKMGSVAAYRAVASIVPSVLSVVFVALTGEVTWVALSTFIGLAAAATLVYLRLRRVVGLRLQRVGRGEMLANLRDGSPLLLNAVLLIIPATGVTVIAGLVLSTRSAGLFSAAWQLTFAALAVAALVVDAVYPELVRRADRGAEQFGQFVRIALTAVARTTLPLTVGVIFAAPSIVRILFGPDYAQSATLLAIVVGAVPLGFFWVILGQALTAANQERRLLRRTAVVTVATLVACPAAAALGGLAWLSGSVLAMAALQVLLYATAPALRPVRALATGLRELPYAAVPAVFCLAVRLADWGDLLPLTAGAVVLGVLVLELVRGWPTPRLVRVIRQPGRPSPVT